MATLTLAICARNAQHIIGDCIESIRRQTVAPDEVILAVDEESDSTIDAVGSAILQPTACGLQPVIRVVVSHGTGLYEARNAVLEACTTDYLAFTDADCVLTPQWVELAIKVLDTYHDVAAGTGRHPTIGTYNFTSWFRHMWFRVETRHTGETDGVIGANSYFRTAALRDVGGWLPLRGHNAAEDMYISKALHKAGHRIWFEEGVAAQHRSETSLDGLWRKFVMMGTDIVVMMRAAGWRDSLWWYTLAIPVLAGMVALGFVGTLLGIHDARWLLGAPLLLTFIYLLVSFRSFRKTLPHWAARWIAIWPYAWGILRGLTAPIPEIVRR